MQFVIPLGSIWYAGYIDLLIVFENINSAVKQKLFLFISCK